MKTRLATALSLAGVLTAGSAAALVNTQILSGDPSVGSASAAVLPPATAVELTIPEAVASDPTVSVPPTTSVVIPPVTTGTTIGSAATPNLTAEGDRTRSSSLSVVPRSTGSTLPTTTMASPQTPSSTTVPTTAATSMLTAFSVGEAGVVTVDVVDGMLMLVAAEPNVGWSVTKTEDAGGDEVEVHFTSSPVRVEFEAPLVSGGIVPEVSAYAI
ncbi:MAG: hypothetical protein ACO307_08430, partial [Ilumatobacteraceae bacterium]